MLALFVTRKINLHLKLMTQIFPFRVIPIENVTLLRSNVNLKDVPIALNDDIKSFTKKIAPTKKIIVNIVTKLLKFH